MFDDIVVVVDGSASGQFAVGAGVTLSRADCSPLTFCVTVDPALTSEGIGMTAFAEMASELGRGVLDGALARAHGAGLSDARGLLITGEPAEEIVALARAKRAGLIVIGLQPRIGILRPFMRSLAEGVLRETAIPLCVTRRPSRGHIARRVLVPIVAEPLTLAALDFAIPFASNFASTLVFCEVASGPGAAEASALLARARNRAERDGVHAEALLLSRSGGVSKTIVQNADVHGCDAIVMASHVREGLPRLVQGSVAESVIYSSDVPVVIVRAQPR